MRQRWSKRGPIAILLVSMLLVALTAGVALAANINGTANADLIGPAPFNGTSLTGDDVIRALAGNDRVDAFTGNDKIYGGDGDDVFTAEDGNKDLINCGTGDDTVLSFDNGLDVVSATCEG